jgi:DNA-binding response OmpR family regulator
MTATALIVFPDAAAQAEYSRHVGALGFRVHRADSLGEARELLESLHPDVLVTTVRLREHNGIHLAHLAHAVKPDLPVVVVGYHDTVLESEAASAGATYVVSTDPQQVAEAARDAVIACRPRRRWERTVVEDRVTARLSGLPARLVDVSYGGFRAELRNGDVEVVTRALELSVPEFNVSVCADPVWTITATASPAYVCGAVVDEGLGADAWRRFVDSLNSI